MFYWYCLTTLGETKEASARLAQFDKGHRIEWPPNPNRGAAKSGTQTKTLPPTAADASPWSSPDSRHQAEALVAIAKSLSVAQVFLSLDNAVGGAGLVHRPYEFGRCGGETWPSSPFRSCNF